MTVRRDEAGQARYVVEKVLGNRETGMALKAKAVLFRASHLSGPLEFELTRRNIPFVKFGGLKYFLMPRTSRTSLRCFASPRIRVTAWQGSCPTPAPGFRPGNRRACPLFLG